MYERGYALTRKIENATVAEVIDRARTALATEGFGVLTEIDIQKTLKQKLGVERPPYVILGACNPVLANRALAAEPAVGVFLPCNVTVFQGEDGATYVQAIKPEAMFGLIDATAMQPIAREVGERLERAVQAI